MRYIFTTYLVFKGIALFALYVILQLNGGIDPISNAPSSIDPSRVLQLAGASLFVLAPFFAWLESIQN
jgi:hypothetical protein